MKKTRQKQIELVGLQLGLFPNQILDKIIPRPDGTSFSEYRFADMFEYYFSPAMIYRHGSLEILIVNEKESKNYGLITNIGGTLIETLNKENKAIQAINKYKSPEKAKDFTGEFSSDGITFLTKANVAVGSTYIVRVFQHKEADAIYAIKVHKKDDDGSIVIFVKDIDS